MRALGNFRAWPVIIGLVLILAGGGAAYGLAIAEDSQGSIESQLPRVKSYDQLIKLLAQAGGQGDYLIQRNLSDVSKSVETMAPADAGSAAEPAAVPAFSGTNVQVTGVDEADLVKTDGQYIYQVNNGRVLVIKAEPAGSMQLAAELQFGAAGFTPVELYVDEANLIVIGQASRSDAVKPAPIPNSNPEMTRIYPPIISLPTTRAVIFDIRDKDHIQKIRELELDGSYLSSRKVGTSFYLLSNKYVDYYYIQQQEGLVPQWRDSIRGPAYVEEKLEDIRYFPDCVSPNYLMVAALDLQQPGNPADIQAYLGSGDQVYASQQNLYVAVQRNEYPRPITPLGGVIYRPTDIQTKIYRFALNPGQVEYSGAGQVPGRILNQFSMDEYGGYFRIATTSGEMWRGDQYTSANNVYTLDQNLQLAGRLEDIAPGERIYSTRFMGNRAYMVTFKQVDPFFVLDLSDPLQPAVLGKLKIPGYSDYLHPYDENHIIGFGKDTTEVKSWGDQSVAFYQGMKIAIFDVTDVSQPIEMSRTLIGDRGTDSELLRNHKALLFSADKNLLAFPVTVMEVPERSNVQLGSIFPEYGSFSFQGLYIYRIDLQNGLQYRGRITHITPAEYLKAGDNWYDAQSNIVRALYIGDNLYTLSQARIQAHRLSDLTEIGNMVLPPAPPLVNPPVRPLLQTE